MLFVLFIHVQQELLDLVAGSRVLGIESGAYAQVQWFLGLFLLWALLEATAFSSESEFDDFL